MSFTVKKIFTTLQGEGRWSGTPAVFVRFSGCNLSCPFCDTDFKGGDKYTEQELIRAICVAANEPPYYTISHIVFTGGEPTLQLTPTLVDRCRSLGFFTQVETNGTRDVTHLGLNWVTCSPKLKEKGGEVVIRTCHELKWVLKYGEEAPSDNEFSIEYMHRYLSPMTDPTLEGVDAFAWSTTVDWCVGQALKYGWNITMQSHKLWGVE